jgi:hypothetical protein
VRRAPGRASDTSGEAFARTPATRGGRSRRTPRRDPRARCWAAPLPPSRARRTRRAALERALTHGICRHGPGRDRVGDAAVDVEIPHLEPEGLPPRFVEAMDLTFLKLLGHVDVVDHVRARVAPRWLELSERRSTHAGEDGRREPEALAAPSMKCGVRALAKQVPRLMRARSEVALQRRQRTRPLCGCLGAHRRARGPACWPGGSSGAGVAEEAEVLEPPPQLGAVEDHRHQPQARLAFGAAEHVEAEAVLHERGGEDARAVVHAVEAEHVEGYEVARARPASVAGEERAGIHVPAE